MRAKTGLEQLIEEYLKSLIASVISDVKKEHLAQLRANEASEL